MMLSEYLQIHVMKDQYLELFLKVMVRTLIGLHHIRRGRNLKSDQPYKRVKKELTDDIKKKCTRQNLSLVRNVCDVNTKSGD